MAGNANLVISITAKDGASSTFRKVKMNLGDLEQSTSGLGDAVGDLGGIFGSTLGKIGAGIGAAFAIEKIASTAFELGKVGAQAQRTQASFDQMAAGVGSSGEAMLSAMRTATAGTVSNSQLMLAANRAMMLGVADNADEMSRLMAAAIERGRALGVDASQAVNDVITGIGRMSPQILDNLGIVGAAAAMDEYAASLGKTADQLTDVEKKQALVNSVLAGASGAVVIDDAAAAFERMDASIQNAKEALGVLFSPAIAAIADQLANAAVGLTDALTPEGISDTANKLAGYAQRLEDIRNQIDALGRVRETLATQPAMAPPEYQQFTPGDIDAQVQALQQQAQAVASIIYETQKQYYALQGIQEQTARTEEAQYAYNQSLWAGQSAWDAFQTAAQIAQQETLAATGQILQGAQGGLSTIARSIAEVQGGEAAVGWLRGATAQLERQIELWAAAGYSVGEITGVLLPRYLDNLQDIITNAQAAYTATAGIGKGAQEADRTAASALARFARRVDNITSRAMIASSALSRMTQQAGATRTSRNGWEWLGTPASYDPIEKATDSATAFGNALEEAIGIGTGFGGGGGISSVGDEFDDLRSKVQGVIDQSTTLDVGLNPADFLPREDAINENARRLAAIMRDGLGNQEWLEEFKTEVPGIFDEIANSGDPQAAAARILQEFQAGMRPELLDKGLIKERVKAMILGDSSSAQLAEEIAQELSTELGVSLAQAREAAGAALGTGTGATMPLEQAGPDGSQTAGNFVTTWTKTVTSMLADFDSTGRSAGNAFGVGFMAVQGTYIDQWAAALVSIVTAGVLANMAAQASRTGAR